MWGRGRSRSGACRRAIVSSDWATDHAHELSAFEMLSQREIEETSRLWQTPTLALTAQAFLLTIALGPDTARVSRVIASLLGIMVAVMAVQLMTKHHHFADRDFQLLLRLENDLGLPKTIKREPLPGMTLAKASWLSRRSSFWLWRRGLVVIGLANVVALVLAIAWPDVLINR
jgi:hypothetical protein